MSGNIDLSKSWSELPEEGGGAHYHCYTPMAVPEGEAPSNIIAAIKASTPQKVENTSRFGEGYIIPTPEIPCW